MTNRGRHMKTSPLNTLVTAALAAAVLLATAWYVPAVAQPSVASTQSSVERGVTVKVTPRKLAGPEWEFAIVLDTHAEDLKDDLQQTAVLVVDGREVRPSQWQGPGAGGHHREGVLRFAMAVENPTKVELRIQRAGETAPRVFSWEGAALR